MTGPNLLKIGDKVSILGKRGKPCDTGVIVNRKHPDVYLVKINNTGAFQNMHRRNLKREHAPRRRKVKVSVSQESKNRLIMYLAPIVAPQETLRLSPPP